MQCLGAKKFMVSKTFAWAYTSWHHSVNHTGAKQSCSPINSNDQLLQSCQAWYQLFSELYSWPQV